MTKRWLSNRLYSQSFFKIYFISSKPYPWCAAYVSSPLAQLMWPIYCQEKWMCNGGAIHLRNETAHIRLVCYPQLSSCYYAYEAYKAFTCKVIFSKLHRSNIMVNDIYEFASGNSIRILCYPCAWSVLHFAFLFIYRFIYRSKNFQESSENEALRLD